jgi:hypothetical protein
MSIRHIAATQNDQVIIGIQYQGNADNTVPLVLSHQGEQQLEPLLVSDYNWQDFSQYIASVAIDDRGKTAIATSPRGHHVAVWDLSTGECVNSITVRDVAGAVYSSSLQQFIVSNGRGQILSLDTKDNLLIANQLLQQPTLHWDNHLQGI